MDAITIVKQVNITVTQENSVVVIAQLNLKTIVATAVIHTKTILSRTLVHVWLLVWISNNT